MSNLRFEAPLVWPAAIPSIPRNQQRNDHNFAPLTLETSIAYLEEELNDIPCKATLFLDIEQPTVERLRKKVGSRTGASLQLRMEGREYALTCDRWQLVEHNIYALHLALRQWRNMERWGVGTLAQLLHGFESGVLQSVAGEAGGFTIPAWMEELGLGATSTLDDAIAIYHRRAKAISGNTEALMNLNILMDDVRAYFAHKTGKAKR